MPYFLSLPLIYILAIFIMIGANLLQWLTIYRNAIINKTRLWPFSVSICITILMIVIFSSLIPTFWHRIKSGEAVQIFAVGVILKFLLLTIFLSISGIKEKMVKQIIDFVENI